MNDESKFDPPKSGEEFVRYWKLFVEDIKYRDNFKDNHLLQLEILCDLYQEMEELKYGLQMTGYTFETEGGRNGVQIKIRPEVSQLNRTRSEIRNYSKMLGLILAKDTLKNEGDEDEEDEWD